MVKASIGIIILLCIPLHAFAGTLTHERAERFILELLDGGDAVEDFVDADALRTAHRLGVRYEGVSNKFLISYDIDESVKNGVGKNGWRYTVAVRDLGDGFSSVLFSVPEKDYKREFYFKGPGLVPSITYLTRNWHRAESEHLAFFISDTTLFNDYCIDNLERFFDTAAVVLTFDDEELERIEREKIFYFLCRDQEEIQLLTGFHARGMFIVAFDFVVTTFNAHYHELMHLLMNYKLREVPLYTHPFLLEGFAVAFGGRGGREPRVILDLGLFLYRSGMIDYGDLLTKNDFYAIDASISYPASGLYNLFLVESLGIDGYLDLYRRYGGTAAVIYTARITAHELPERAAWRDFVAALAKERVVEFIEPPDDAGPVYADGSVNVSEDGERYYFALQDTLLIGAGDGYDGFQSTVYSEIIGDGDYRSEKYMIAAGEDEISIYNLYTNNLIANYVASFSIPPAAVPIVDGNYRFSIRKYIFDGVLTGEMRFTRR